MSYPTVVTVYEASQRPSRVPEPGLGLDDGTLRLKSSRKTSITREFTTFTKPSLTL